MFDSLLDVIYVVNPFQFSQFVIVGDFNVNMMVCSSYNSYIVSFCSHFNLLQVVVDCTYVRADGYQSLLDLVFVSDPDHVLECSTIPPLANSDHYGIFFRLSCPIQAKQIRPKREVWRYAHMELDRACIMLQSLDLDLIFASDDVDECWRCWKQSFLGIMEECIPRATLPDSINPPWLSKRILQMIKKQNYYYRLAKHNRQSCHHAKYRRLRSAIVSALRQAKASFFSSLDPKCSKTFWKSVQAIRSKATSIPVFSVNGVQITSSSGKANLLNNYFTCCFNTLVPPLTHGTLAVGHSIPFPDDLLCCEEEVALLLSKIDISKSSGPDGISGQMLKLTAYSSAPAITRLFNLSLTSGCVPKEWKCAWVSPVPKVAGTTDYTQFRPVSLLPVISKILERHVQAYLLEWALTESLISDDQWGFLCGRSTTGALVNTVDRWHRCLERGNEVCAVFLDLKKAFDRVPHRPLLDKLRALNINPFVLQWLENYLMHRSQTVVVGGESSAPASVLSGVPQGSVLGPLLFLLYINGVTEVVTSDCALSLYADDNLLFCEIIELSDYARVQENINLVHAWFLEWFMEFNISKCKFMVISKKRSRYGPHIQLSIDGISLERVNEFKYLGVWLIDTLGWSVHVSKTVRRASKQVGMIYRVFHQYASQLTLLKLYLAHVRPLLEYASQLWDPHQKVLIDSLERVQKFGLRMSCKQWRSDYESLLAWAVLPSLKTRRSIAKLCYLNKMLRGVMHSSIPLPEPRNMDSRLRSFQDSMLLQPFARTNSYKFSFYPDSIALWNHLPPWVRDSPSLSAFKNNLRILFC